MSLATPQLNVIPKRMLTQTEAAHHCGRPLNRFKLERPVSPIVFPNGDRRFDLNDPDGRLDSIKPGADHEVDEILARLG